MTLHSFPRFLEGTFDWRLNGLHLDTEAHTELAAATRPESNAWTVMASVLERAQSGDHTGIPSLAPFFHEHETPALARSALMLVGDAGRETDLEMLKLVIEGDDPESRVYACEAAALAGRLWLVPSMLNAWENAETVREHEVIGYAISDLLEPEGGPIAGEAGVFPTAGLAAKVADRPGLAALAEGLRLLAEEPVRFPALVRSAYDALCEQYGSEHVTVWNGELFHVPGFARHFLEFVRRREHVSLFDYRHKLEANTGIDCRNFFDGSEPQLLEIAATIESFLESTNAENYLPGVRYFFGHRIPD